MPHTGRIAASGSYLFSVDIPARLAASVFRDKTSPLEPLGPRLTGLMFRTWSELHTLDGMEPLLLESLVAEVLAAAGAAPRSSAARRAWLPKVPEILHQHLRNPPTLSEIAREVEVHPCHLARTFGEAYRRSVGEHQRYLRVAFAAAELAATSHSLVDIAYETGFADQSHFVRVFLRIVGVSPGKYRTLLH